MQNQGVQNGVELSLAGAHGHAGWEGGREKGTQVRNTQCGVMEFGLGSVMSTCCHGCPAGTTKEETKIQNKN